MANTRKIIERCRENNIVIVFQNYPQGFQTFNKYLRNLAEEYRIPFVDNYSIFSELIKKNSRQKYLIGDGHCTPEGYEIVAQNVYAVLVKEKLL